MIIGIGTDCCEMERIADVIERRGDRFLARVFTDAERAAGGKRPEPTAYFARRFAAKEACAKALGSGITGRVSWHDVEVLNGDQGRPTLRLTGGALRRLNRLIPKGHEPALHVSLSDDPPMALAFVILEARLKS
ncbi:holo-ACP synthase [Bradyrhizobium elkanii]|jgi:holo-[acyl-carrier protein] synthase|uniref:holo-ACP synthase n=1 Tax=Bradyrhizobium elkanii TaxID=29448 RepID=UPI00271492DE|nr:holo-ACP synthase [Bradyrhizobium elkanii]WLB05131.1 holo-ACP synthase [Bradyrhizobium elkanii]